MIKAIITDWHGVIDRKTFEKFVVLIAKEIDEDPIKCRKQIKKIATAWTIGIMGSEQFWTQLKSLFNLKDSQIQKLKDYILSIDLDEQVVSFFENNKNNYQITLLSDCPADKANVIKNSKIFGLFKATSFSCDKHITKENPQFFLNFLEELRLSADDCLYIDDNKKHIDTALSLGFKTHLFGKAEDLTS